MKSRLDCAYDSVSLEALCWRANVGVFTICDGDSHQVIVVKQERY